MPGTYASSRAVTLQLDVGGYRKSSASCGKAGMNPDLFSSNDRILHSPAVRAVALRIAAEPNAAEQITNVPARSVRGAPLSFRALVLSFFCLHACYTSPTRGQTANQTSPDSSQSARHVFARVLGHCGRGASGSGRGDADYLMVYKSKQSIVCVDRNFWKADDNARAISKFFPYFDAVIVQDKTLFPVKTPDAPFAFVITIPTGSGHAGCDLRKVGAGGTFCNTVSGDFFTKADLDPVTGNSIRGFWGYLIPLHESINLFTGLLSPGWPTDWWADHRSPFPNAMDVELLRSIAAKADTLDPAMRSEIAASADLQLHRFADPANPTRKYDREVAMFLDLFDRFGGFASYARAFEYAIGEDRLQWTSVSQVTSFNGDDNHSENLSEYVIAYLQLGFGTDQDLTPMFRTAGVGTMDKKIAPYEIDSTKIREIATAHCSIRAAANAGLNVNRQLRALQAGNFRSAIAQGGSSSSCPIECTFRDNSCVAKF